MDHGESDAEYRRQGCTSPGSGPKRRDEASESRRPETDRSRPIVPVPWFATPVPEQGNPALRPVPEDEIEELDEIGPWELRPARRRPVELRIWDPHHGSGLVAGAVGRALKAHRWSLRLTQREYARRTGRGQGTVSRLERGSSPLSVPDLIELAFETGRTITVQVMPDNTRVAERGPVEYLRVGTNGSVRVSVGAAPAVPPPAPA
jgi:DNA-binding XRE family transcriptional regulator